MAFECSPILVGGAFPLMACIAKDAGVADEEESIVEDLGWAVGLEAGVGNGRGFFNLGIQGFDGLVSIVQRLESCVVGCEFGGL
jgi:hypothetical protein